jgi:hypothetical protein
MIDATVLSALALVAAMAALLAAWVYGRRALDLAGPLVGGVGAIHEALLASSAKLQHLAVVLEAGQGANGVGTKVAELETICRQNQLLVADAVEKVTSLSSRVQTRVRRAQNERGLLDEDDDGEPVTPQERREALAQLAAAGAGITVDPGTAAAPSKRSGSGWDRVRRTAAGARREA